MEWPNFLDKKLDFLYDNQELLKNFKCSSTNFDRVDLLTRNHSLMEDVNTFLDKFKNSEEKSVNLSESHRKQGNYYFSKKDNKNSFSSYTLALNYAKDDPTSFNKSLILAYSNRSAVFYDESLFQNCLLDLESVKYHLKTSVSQNHLSNPDLTDLYNLIFKLLHRELNCLLKLNSVQGLANFNKNTFFSILSSTKFSYLSTEIKDKTDSLLSQVRLNGAKSGLIEAQNELVYKNFVNKCVDVKFRPEKGRHCLTNEAIKPGECLFVEKAYCAILLPEFNSSYCQHCFKKIYNEKQSFYLYFNIQCCSVCSSVFYCSLKCKNENFNTHKYECGVLKTLLHNLGISHLAYKILASTNDHLIQKYSKQESSIDVMKIDYKLDNPESNYNQVFNLQTHEAETHLDDLLKYTLTSILLGAHYLRVKKSASFEDLKITSSLILRHLLQTICNAHAITQLNDSTSQSETFNREQIRFATAIYPRVSLLNHSCNPNVISSFKEDSSVIVVKASRTIEAFEEIFNCYGPHYLKMSLFDRRQSLFEQYRFKCDCDACENQLKIEDSAQSGLRCLNCKSDLVKSIGRIKVKCDSCGTQTDFRLYLQVFEKLNSELGKIKSKNGIEKLDLMLEEYRKYLLIDENFEVDGSLKIDENLKKFYLDFSKIIDLKSRLNCELKQFGIASFLLEKNVKLLEFIYDFGESNIEIAFELFKLAEIQCNCNEFQKALLNVDKAIEIAENVYSKENQAIKEFYELKNNILSVLN